MSLVTLIRIVSGLLVLGVVIFTALLVRHVREEPLGGVFGELVPVAFEAEPVVELPAPSADLPEIDPGAKVFERARELIAVGDLPGARDKLRTVVSIYPRSKKAPEARRIVGEMNLDEILSPAHMEGKTVYEVKRGDSYLGIAAKHQTSLDLIMHLNGLMDLGALQPGDELVVMPMNFRLVIEPLKGALSVWEEGRFVKDYPLVEVAGAPTADLKTRIESKLASLDGKRFAPSSEGYRGAPKSLALEKVPLTIAGLAADAEREEGGLARGFYVAPEDMEELALLLRPGNEVEIRANAR